MRTLRNNWRNLSKPLRVTGYIVMGICAAAAMGIVFGFAIMLLWNWLMPQIFGLGEITYWQAIGIFILAKFIFGFGMGGGDNSKSNKEDKQTPRFKDECDYDEWWEKEGKNAFDRYSDEKYGRDNNNA